MQRSKAVVALVLTGIVVLLNAMAASPTLHELFHPDASDEAHQCAVTMFTHGGVDSASADVPVVAPLPLIQTVSFAYSSIFCPAIEQLPAGRAPPVSSLHS